MKIGERIRELRKRAKFTQPELAEKIGVHETTLRRWEQDKDKGAGFDMLQKIAEALNTTVGYLMGESDNPESEKTSDENKNLPIMNVEDKEPENPNLGLGYWGTVADNARKIANEGNAQEKAAVMMMLNMAVNAFNEAQGTGNFLPQAVGFQGNNNQVHNNYVRT